MHQVNHSDSQSLFHIQESRRDLWWKSGRIASIGRSDDRPHPRTGVDMKFQLAGQLSSGSLMLRWAILVHSPGPPHAQGGWLLREGVTSLRRRDSTWSCMSWRIVLLSAAEGHVPVVLTAGRTFWWARHPVALSNRKMKSIIYIVPNITEGRILLDLVSKGRPFK